MGRELDRRHVFAWGLGLASAFAPFTARAQDGKGGGPAADGAAPGENGAPHGANGAGPFEIVDWKLDGDRDLARRAVVLVPRDVPPGTRLPVLVLLHGLGETVSDALGVRAWIDRYGLLTSHARLARPPVVAETRRGDLSDERQRAVNDDLGRRAYVGRTIVVCPFTPNVGRIADTQKALDRYAAWIADVLLPAVRQRTPADDSAAHTSIDGCSLGGYVGLEVFLRKPEIFGAWGGVQSAIGEARAPAYALRLADTLRTAGPRCLHIETSLGDPFYRANAALSRELRKKDVAHDFLALPGPHDQPWLREAGTLEMLLWHDRALQGSCR